MLGEPPDGGKSYKIYKKSCALRAEISFEHGRPNGREIIQKLNQKIIQKFD